MTPLLGRHGGSKGGMVAHREAWWLKGRHGGSKGGMVAHREAWWLNGSAPDCCPAVLGSNPASPQPTADCQSPDGLPPGMALGCGLTSVRGDRGENHEKGTAGFAKNI
jgi:hypothetical protein